mmetsp:Transcript_11389/g.22734  ORF Transcript_11389/g.22734 Transcript_11389/m.22734 type:complete len:403 (+) Transcript_11389:1600-2808(+)
MEEECSCSDLKTANNQRWEYLGSTRPLKAQCNFKQSTKCIPVTYGGRNLIAFNVVRFLLLNENPEQWGEEDEMASRGLVSRVDLSKHGNDTGPSDTSSITSMDFTSACLDDRAMLVAFSSGEVQAMPLPIQSSSTDFYSRIMRFNSQKSVNSSACVRAVWAPDDASGTCFIAVYEDGDIIRHHKIIGNSSDSDLLNQSSSGGGHDTTESIIHLEGCSITTAEMSPDGRYMAVGTRTGALIIVDLQASGKTVGGFHSFFGAITCCAWSGDGTVIAAGGEDDLISIWKVGSDRVQAHCEGHTSWVSSVAFVNDESCSSLLLVSVGQDCRLCMWDIALEDEESSSMHVCDDGTHAVDVRQDEMNMISPVGSLVVDNHPLSHVCCMGTMILAGGYDGTVTCWKQQK